MTRSPGLSRCCCRVGAPPAATPGCSVGSAAPCEGVSPRTPGTTTNHSWTLVAASPASSPSGACSLRGRSAWTPRASTGGRSCSPAELRVSLPSPLVAAATGGSVPAAAWVSAASAPAPSTGGAAGCSESTPAAGSLSSSASARGTTIAVSSSRLAPTVSSRPHSRGLGGQWPLDPGGARRPRGPAGCWGDRWHGAWVGLTAHDERDTCQTEASASRERFGRHPQPCYCILTRPMRKSSEIVADL
jgi:hypothetical protein